MAKPLLPVAPVPSSAASGSSLAAGGRRCRRCRGNFGVAVVDVQHRHGVVVEAGVDHNGRRLAVEADQRAGIVIRIELNLCRRSPYEWATGAYHKDLTSADHVTKPRAKAASGSALAAGLDLAADHPIEVPGSHSSSALRISAMK